MSTSTAPIKVSAEVDQQIGHAAHFLGKHKKTIVEEAVLDYIEKHRPEIENGVTDALARLDGTREARVAMLAGVSLEDLRAVGGMPAAE